MKLAQALQIINNARNTGKPVFPVFLACGFTPLHANTFLAANLLHLSPDRVPLVINGIFGDLEGNLDRLKASGAECGVVIIEWADLDPRLGYRSSGSWTPESTEDIVSSASATALRFTQALVSAAASIPLVVCLPTLPLPPISHLSEAESGMLDLSLRSVVNRLAMDVFQLKNVKVLNQQHMDRSVLVSERYDVRSDFSSGFPYQLEYASVLFESVAQLAVPRQPMKGLITDLDNTMWRGILGEEGVNGVTWELDRGSHIHALYQKTLNAIAASGALVAVASKNDATLVTQSFERKDLIVQPEHLFPIEANWQDKSRSVSRIMSAWNIGPDAVVFVDDSPLELAEVKNAFPEMTCLRFPPDDNDALKLIRKIRDLFGKPEIHAEDLIRTRSLRQSEQFRSLLQEDPATTKDEFLADLNAVITFTRIDPGDTRPFELINKTNQFNLNGRRLSRNEFETSILRENSFALAVAYEDKFGPLGTIAVILGQMQGNKIGIDTWVMSCRAFSRRIEHKCLEYLFNSSRSAAGVVLDLVATERNGPVRDFIAEFVEFSKDSPCIISQEVFTSRKPSLSHRIIEIAHG